MPWGLLGARGGPDWNEGGRWLSGGTVTPAVAVVSISEFLEAAQLAGDVEDGGGGDLLLLLYFAASAGVFDWVDVVCHRAPLLVGLGGRIRC